MQKEEQFARMNGETMQMRKNRTATGTPLSATGPFTTLNPKPYTLTLNPKPLYNPMQHSPLCHMQASSPVSNSRRMVSLDSQGCRTSHSFGALWAFGTVEKSRGFEGVRLSVQGGVLKRRHLPPSFVLRGPSELPDVAMVSRPTRPEFEAPKP